MAEWRREITGGEESLLQDRHLNHQETVAGLLRDYAAEILQARARFHRGESPSQTILDATTNGAGRLADVFLGRQGGYHVTAWNSPEQLGTHLKRQMRLSTSPEESVQQALLHFGAYVNSLAAMGEEGKVTEEMVQTGLDGIIRQGMLTFLGIPDPAAEQRRRVEDGMRGLDEGDVTFGPDPGQS